jgi:hypothetical protein
MPPRTHLHAGGTLTVNTGESITDRNTGCKQRRGRRKLPLLFMRFDDIEKSIVQFYKERDIESALIYLHENEKEETTNDFLFNSNYEDFRTSDTDWN